jgi:hypothetical protein
MDSSDFGSKCRAVNTPAINEIGNRNARPKSFPPARPSEPNLPTVKHRLNFRKTANYNRQSLATIPPIASGWTAVSSRSSWREKINDRLGKCGDFAFCSKESVHATRLVGCITPHTPATPRPHPPAHRPV